MAELTVPPVAPAGADVALRPAVRWLLLAWTLLGLTAMHTLGHAGHTMAMADHPAAARPQSAATLLAARTVDTTHPAMLMRDGCPNDCAHVGDGSPAGGGSEGWSVCLAILTALAVLVLLGWLLRATTRHGTTSTPSGNLPPTPRAPPHLLVGLRLADLSVLRR
ncbi:MAG: hypothetical protein JWP76_809 [Dactylosporangium sp.]|jgi:hypothetical protein|nr:hypothetical protein [Dactylosporangium sp.]